MKILFYPAFGDDQAFGDHYHRAIWYLNPLGSQIESVAFPQLHELASDHCPDYLDPSLTGIAPQFAALTPVVRSENDLQPLIEEADLVLVWKVDPAQPHGRIDALTGKTIIRLDHKNIQYAGSFYLMVAEKFPQSRAEAEASSRKLFPEIVKRCSSERGYLFGTGPNLKEAASFNFSDGVSIACNSMVRNDALMDRLTPPLIVVGDPIFHAGPSTYAAAFRKDLIRCMDKYGSYLIVPQRDFHIYREHLPERMAARICAIPYVKSEEPNLDLLKNFCVTSTANILTLFLLPLAGTLFKNIAIAGCDGRPVNENSYFWKHDPSSQFQPELEVIKSAHPAFFNVDYDDYYTSHCNTVERWILGLEKDGHTIDCLTPSYIPALASRMRAGSPERQADKDHPDMLNGDLSQALVIVDPDGKSRAGHFLAYNSLLGNASTAAGYETVIIGRHDLDATDLPETIEVIKCLSTHSWNISLRTDGRRTSDTDAFKSELKDGLLKLAGRNYRQVFVYMYCGSLEYARIAHELTSEFKNFHFHVNVFWQYAIKAPTIYYKNRWRPDFAQFTKNERLHLTAPTSRIADQIESLFAVRLPVAPHPSTTFSDKETTELTASPSSQAGETFRILFPGGVRMEKGFHLTIESARLLAEDSSNKLIVRANPKNSDPTLKSQIDKLSEFDAQVVSRSLNDEEFQEFLAEGDIIVCPYLKSAFAARTSGLVIDAMILGKPVVALEGTWLGDLVTKEGFGLAVAPDAVSIARAVEKIKERYAYFASRAADARSTYLQNNSWTKLVADITELPATSISPAEKTVPVEQFEETRKQLIEKLPSNLRSPIFLPTDRIAPAQQLKGLQRVIDLYDGPLDTHRKKLLELREARTKKRCFIIGNGPSLNDTDLFLLKDEVTFATNGFFLKLPELSWAPTYYVVEDHLVAEDRAEEINRLRGFNKLFPASLAYILDEDDDTVFFDHRPRKSFPDGFDFSFDAHQNTFAGGTVTFTCMQLAAFLGFEEIYLIGVDASYAVPDDAKLSGNSRVKEIDMESDDPNHFHPDYFGKGKRWHEPNVDVMIKAYEEARRATEARGVSIINATRGGKLEVFPRTNYYSLFGESKKKPRVLLLDMTPLGDGSATGQLKSSLFEDWPKDRLMQIYHVWPDSVGVALNGKKSEEHAKRRKSHILSLIKDYDPQVILYRPTPRTPALHNLAREIIRTSGLPLVTWIMDDWPVAYAKENPDAAKVLLADWKHLLEISTTRLSICDAMSSAFSQRYGVPFLAIANGIDPDEWPVVTSEKSDLPIRVRYAGSLAENMSLDSIKLVAAAIEKLAEDGLDIVFEIKTREQWYQLTRPHFKDFHRTSFMVADLAPEDYREWLSNADISIIGYNFDENSKSYTQYSLANKLPECLASGSAVLAIGPPDVATISTLKDAGCAVVVEVNTIEAVGEAVSKLANSSEMRFSLARKAQQTAFDDYNIKEARNTLERVLKDAPHDKALEEQDLPRGAQAHVDETEVVSKMLSDRQGRQHVMIDVGAHYGTSASYFDKLGWSIHCFEPDPNNRQRLLKRFADSQNVIIDPRAVSDAPASGVKFFTSEQSTGISGLHAFHETHSETGLVNITTVADVVADRKIKKADFLKIDVEGFDLNVLKGVPWDTFKPDVIECEFEDAKTVRLGHTWKDIANYLQARGYTVYVSEWHPIVRYGIPHDWRRVFRYPSLDMTDKAWGNLLAFRKDPGLKSVKAAFESAMKFRSAAKTPESNTKVQLNRAANGKPAALAKAENASLKSSAKSKVKMLKKTDDRPLAHTPAPHSRIAGMKRFALTAWVHFWARRVWTFPAAILALAAFGATFVPPFAEFGSLARLALTIAAIAAAILYVAFRAFSQITALHLEIKALKDEALQLRMDANRNRDPFRSAPRTSVESFVRSNVEPATNKAVAPLRSALDQQSKTLADLQLSISSTADKLEHRLGMLDEQLKGISEIRSGIENLEDSIVHTKSHAEQFAQAKFDDLSSTLDKSLSGLTASVAAMESQVTEAATEVAEAKNLSQTLHEKVRDLQKWSQIDHSRWYQFFNRRLKAAHVETLESEWPKRLSVPITKARLGYMAERACNVERDLDGRLATSIEDVLLRTLVAKSIKGQKAEILEIGTLFGIGAAIIYDGIKSQFDDLHFTLLDPLEGYYHASQADILTGLTVNEDVVRQNFARVGMTEDNYTLVKKLSTDIDAITDVSKKQYDLLIIDGDHSYAGVKTDFENYAQSVKIGGYIIFDDYGSDEWPEVQEYIDKELADVDYIARVGASWRTCVYRVVKAPVSSPKARTSRKPQVVASDVATTTIDD
jgi:FkbM family methyltransferase